MVFLLAAIGVGVYLAMNPQTFFSSAQQTTTTPVTQNQATGGQGASCPAPGTPPTVLLTYPFCSGGQTGETCQFDKAGCEWEAATGASKYSVKATEVETGAVIKTETVTTTSTSFPVVQGRTYKCEVTALSDCGSASGVNSDTLLCETDAFIPSPTPVATPVPTPPPATPAPTPPPIACGVSGCSASVPCQDGYICIETSVGANYCAKADYQSACYRSPNTGSCCQPPAPKPTLAPAGEIDQTLIIGGAGLGLVILGAAALLML